MKMFLNEEERTFTFDHSTQALGCDRKLYWRCKEGLRKKTEGIPTYFGKALHKFVERFWLGEDYNTCLEAYQKYALAPNSPLLDDPTAEENRTVQRGNDVCMWYYKIYSPERARIKVFELGGKAMTEIPFAFVLGKDGEGWTYIYTGRIDRVEHRDGNQIWVSDLKHTTWGNPEASSDKFGKQIRPNDQLTGYAAAWREIFGERPKFLEHDIVFVGTPRKKDDKGNFKIPKKVREAGSEAELRWIANVGFGKFPTSRSDDDIDDWWQNAWKEGCRMRRLWQQYHINDWTKRTSQCMSYGGCEFRDLCALTSKVELVVNELYVVSHWSPFGVEEEKDD